MANCEHAAEDICKSCQQTLREGGNVRLSAKAEPRRSEPEPEEKRPRGR